MNKNDLKEILKNWSDREQAREYYHDDYLYEREAMKEELKNDKRRVK